MFPHSFVGSALQLPPFVLTEFCASVGPAGTNAPQRGCIHSLLLHMGHLTHDGEVRLDRATAAAVLGRTCGQTSPNNSLSLLFSTEWRSLFTHSH